MFKAIRAIYSDSGIIGLYRGHSMTLLRIFPYASIQFTAYERFKQLLHVDDYPKSKLRRFLCGAFAGTTAVSFTYPFDIIRTRLIYTLYKKDGHLAQRHNSIGSIFQKLLRERFSFFQGYPATLLGIFVYAGSSFFTFESLKQITLQKYFYSSTNLPSFPKFLCGVTAGLVGQTVAYPFDVVRRRMQLRSSSLQLSTYTSITNSIRQVFKKEGIRGFFVGLSINYLKVGPSTGVAFVTYEYVKEKLQKQEK